MIVKKRGMEKIRKMETWVPSQLEMIRKLS